MTTKPTESNRPTWDKMKALGISSLDVWRMTSMCGIPLSKRTIHNYLETEFMACTDDRIKCIVKDMIKNKEALKRSLLKEYKF